MVFPNNRSVNLLGFEVHNKRHLLIFYDRSTTPCGSSFVHFDRVHSACLDEKLMNYLNNNQVSRLSPLHMEVSGSLSIHTIFNRGGPNNSNLEAWSSFESWDNACLTHSLWSIAIPPRRHDVYAQFDRQLALENQARRAVGEDLVRAWACHAESRLRGVRKCRNTICLRHGRRCRAWATKVKVCWWQTWTLNLVRETIC